MQVKTMETIFRPVQKVPALVKEQRTKHPKVYFWSVVGIIVILCFSALHFFIFKRMEVMAEEQALVKRDIYNLKESRSREARALYIQEQLVSNPTIKKALGEENIAPFAFKLLSLEAQYKDDGITAALLLGLIEVESGFNPKALSSAGAYGIMQVLRSTATPYLRGSSREWSEAAMYDPSINMEVGTAFLVDLHRMFIDRGWEKKEEFTFTLSSYNMGEGALRTYVNNKDKIYLNYVVKVKLAMKKWDALGI